MALTTIPSELSSVSGISDSSSSTAITIDSSQNVTFSGNITTGSNTISGVLSSVTGSIGSAATATTQAASDNSTKLATTAYVTTALANLVDSAPGTLNTLNELAAALGDDANFSTTVTNSIATKAPLANPTFTGSFTSPGIDDNASSTAVTIDSNNRMAIGGTVVTDVNLLNIQGSGSFSNIGVVLNDTSTSKIYSIQNGGSALKFFDYTASAERMRIDSSGNVQARRARSNTAGEVALSVQPSDSTIHYGFRIDSSTNSFNLDRVDSAAQLLTVSSAGNVGIGTSSMSSYYAKNLVVMADGDNTGGITIAAPATDDTTYLAFADGTSGAAAYAGYVGYTHNGDDLLLGAGGATRVTIDSSGIDVTGSVTADGLTIGDTSVGQSLIQMLANSTNGANTIHFGDATSGAASYVGYINYAHDSNSMQFSVGGSEAMRIDSSGTLALGTTDTHQWTVFDGRIRLGATACFASTSVSTQMMNNAYYDNNYRYITNGTAARYYQNGGAHYWDVAASGSADGVMSFSEVARITNTGNMGIGETIPLGRLHVRTADSGATVDVSADELVVEGSGNAGISILSGQSYAGSIYFGDAGVNWDGYISYSQAARKFTFGAAAGAKSLSIDSTGIYTSSYAGDATNTVYGADAFTSAATGAENNTVIGRSAWYWGTTGDNNVVIGHNACLDNVSNINQMASSVYVGKGSGLYNVGNLNVVIGTEAGYRNYGGSSVLIGYRAGGYYNSSSSGNNNVAVGMNSLYAVTTGSDNAILGRDAGAAITTGYGNVFLGRDAGDSATSGYRNICIGQNANPSSASGEHQIILGHDISGPGDNHAMIGRGGQGYWKLSHTVNTGWVFVSDERIKKNIQNDTLGLEFINKIRPVTYNHKKNEEIDADFLDSTVNWKKGDADDTVLHRGLVAQEVKAAMQEVGNTDFDGWSQDADGMQGISKEAFITPLIKAVQELSAEVTALKAEVAALKGE